MTARVRYLSLTVTATRRSDSGAQDVVSTHEWARATHDLESGTVTVVEPASVARK